jgi:hypothetical protein
LCLDTLRRNNCAGRPLDLGKGFRLEKHEHEAVCRLRKHQLGWELVLDVGGALHRSEVCRSQDAFLDLTDRWKAALLSAGGNCLL